MALFQLTGSLRIGNGLGFGAVQEAGLAEGESPPYMEALVKLFPAEGAALAAIAAGFADSKLWLSIILIVAISVMVFFLRYKATQPEGGGTPDWIAIVIAVISFYLYAIAIRAFGTFFSDPATHAGVMGVVSGIWTILVPLFPKKS